MSASKMPVMTAVCPRNTPSVLKKTPCVVAKELGYSENAILTCYEDGMSAGDLVMSMLNFNERHSLFAIYSDVSQEIRVDTSSQEAEDEHEKVMSLTLKEEADSKNQQLRDETFTLWKMDQCKKCWKNKASRLALPCCHLAVCEPCCDELCIVCDILISEWIKVYVT